jgi:hypothetical protein
MTANSLTAARTDGAGLFPQCAHGCGPCDVYQPDQQTPDRLLAVCPACGLWLCSIDAGGYYHRVMPPAPTAPDRPETLRGNRGACLRGAAEAG